MNPQNVTKAAAVLLYLFMAGTEAQAISRYNIASMSCADIHATVRAEGAVILRWIQPPDILRYDRFVDNFGFCGVGEGVVPFRVPSASNGPCSVNVCRRCERDRGFINRPFICR